MALEPPHLSTKTLHPSSCGVATSNTTRASPVTLDLLRSPLSSTLVDLVHDPSPLPLGWQRYLDLKTGKIFYRREPMSRNGKSPKLDLKLNLSPPRRGNGSGVVGGNSPRGSSSSSSSSSPMSPPSSCVSSESDQGQKYSNSPEATSMVLVGCPRCLMYVMLSEEDPKCPKCKSTVLLDFLHDNTTKKKKKN